MATKPMTRDCFNVTIMGSSFVRRLSDDIFDRTNMEFYHNYDFDEVMVKYVCKGGWMVKDLERQADQVVHYWPDIVIIHCGGNDLCRNKRPETVASALLETADKIRQESGAKRVVVCEILKRQLGKYLRTTEQVEQFNREAKIANSYLKHVAPEFKDIKFWRHRGLSNPTLGPVLDTDGVHLNGRGQYKFYKSIRGAINFAMKH